MKKIIVLVFGLSILSISVSAQVAKGESLARKMASKMKDSLELSPKDENKIYQVNMRIAKEKEKLWIEYRTSPYLRGYLQRVENKRDSLYKEVLPAEKYLLYKEKKDNLINNR